MWIVGVVGRVDGHGLAALRVLCGHGNRSVLIKVKSCANLIKYSAELFAEGVKILKRCWLAVVILTLVVSALAVSRVEGFDLFLTSTPEHHVAGLNSNLPYVAGFDVIADNLTLYEGVKATAVMVSFPSTEPELLPSGCWLGGGMFVQGQDHVFNNVDYGFYMMLVLEASGGLFVDLGLHQTEEATAPIQMPLSNLVYAYTWQITGVDRSTPVTLLQSWNSNGSVDYSMSVSGQDENLITVNVVGMLNCQNIIRTFFAGNVVDEPFPVTRYVNYFQFGIISSQAISDTHWQVDVKEPRMLTQTGWTLVNKAWSIQGDHSYLDYNLMWGGATYPGVDAQYYPLQEIIFSYNGRTLPAGTVLWGVRATNNSTITYSASGSQAFTLLPQRFLPVITSVLGLAMLLPFLLARRRRTKNLRLLQISNTARAKLEICACAPRYLLV